MTTKTSRSKEPLFFFDSLPLTWLMTRCEKLLLASLVDQADARIAIEVGTFKGGSLQVIAAKADKVYSLDIDKETQEALKPQFAGVEFLAGDSRVVLPQLIAKMQAESTPLGFVLIDGDHSTEGVRSDIDALLKFVPNRPVYIAMHDSFNPECRRGMLTAAWHECPYVHFVEIDFIPGTFCRDGGNLMQPRSMWGGMAVAIMRPEKRDFDLHLLESQRNLFEAVLAQSSHVTSTGKSLLQRVADTLTGSRSD